MSQSKNKIKFKQGTDQNDALLKKLPGLLALCEFALIPFLVISPSLSVGVAHVEDPPGRDNARSAGVYPPQGGTQGGTQGAALHERTISTATPSEVQIAAVSEPTPREVIQVTVTAYSSTKDQTDNTPFHTANGNEVRDGIVAANFLPLGTQVRIPEVFGDKIFTVLDRMHERFDRRIDIWMPTREAAQEFGIRYLQIEIF